MRYLIGGYSALFALTLVVAGGLSIDTTLLTLAVPVGVIGLFGWCLEDPRCQLTLSNGMVRRKAEAWVESSTSSNPAYLQR